MKSLLISALLFVGMQSWAVENGYYECETIVDYEQGEESSLFGIKIFEDKFVMLGNGADGSDESFIVGAESDDYLDADRTAEDDEFGLEYLRYKLYFDSNGNLKMLSNFKYLDMKGPVTTKTLFSQNGENQAKMNSQFTDDEGLTSVVNANCYRQIEF